MFIVLEGPEGSGKTSLSRALARKLPQRLAVAADQIVTTREPGGSWVGDQIRSLCYNPEWRSVNVAAQTLLILAARLQHCQQIINPALQAGKTVICDRWLISTLVYQAQLVNQPIAPIIALSEQILPAAARPHTTYLLLADAAVLEHRIKRLRAFRSPYNASEITIREQIVSAYRDVARAVANDSTKYPVKILDATLSQRQLCDTVIDDILTQRNSIQHLDAK